MPSLAQKLRADPTVAERRLWRLIHPFRTNGYHFRKQVALGPYVADFTCFHANLVIEVDGDTHFSDSAARRDAERDSYLYGRGLTVLRFSNDDVTDNPEGVYTVIASYLATHEPRPKRAATLTSEKTA